MLRPSPARDSPVSLDFLQRKSPHRVGFFHWLPMLLVSVVRGNDDIGPVARDINMPRLADRDSAIGDSILLGVGVIVGKPFRASSRPMPLMGWKFVDDAHLVRAQG